MILLIKVLLKALKRIPIVTAAAKTAEPRFPCKLCPKSVNKTGVLIKRNHLNCIDYKYLKSDGIASHVTINSLHLVT